MDLFKLLTVVLLFCAIEACPTQENDAATILGDNIAESRKAILLYNGDEQLLSTLEKVFSRRNDLDLSIYGVESARRNTLPLAASQLLVLWRPNEENLRDLMQMRLLDVERIIVVQLENISDTMHHGSLARRWSEMRVDAVSGCADIVNRQSGNVWIM